MSGMYSSPEEDEGNGDEDEVIMLSDEESGPMEEEEEVAEEVDEASMNAGEAEPAEPPAEDSSLRLVAHTKDVFCLALSKSGKWLASGSEDDTAAVWDLAGRNSEPHLKIAEHKDSVTCLAFNASETLLASGDMAGRIVITKLSKQQEHCRIDEEMELEWLLWHSAADILLAGTTEGQVWLWLISASDGEVKQSKVLAIGSVSACVSGALLADSKRLLCAYGDGQIRVWDLKQGSALSSIPISSSASPCCSLETHPTLELAAVGCMDGTLTMVNTHGGKLIWQQKLPISNEQKENELTSSQQQEDSSDNSSVEVVRFSPPDYHWLAAGTANGMMAIYDYESGTQRYGCQHDGMAIVNALWLMAGGELCIASACIDGAIRMWNAKSGDPVKLLSGGGDEIYDMCLVKAQSASPNDVYASARSEKKLLTACSNGVIRVFEL